MLTVSDNSNNNQTISPIICKEKKFLNVNNLQKIHLNYRQSSPQILLNENQKSVNCNNNNIFNDKTVQIASTCLSDSSNLNLNYKKFNKEKK